MFRFQGFKDLNLNLPSKRKAAGEKWLRSRTKIQNSTILELMRNWAIERNNYLDIEVGFHCWQWKWEAAQMNRWQLQTRIHKTANLSDKLWARRLRKNTNLCHHVDGISRWMCSCRLRALGREERKSKMRRNWEKN